MRIKAFGICGAFTFGILGELSGWAVRYLSPAFAYVKIASFLGLQSVILWLMVVVAGALWRESPSAYAGGDGTTPPRIP
jgi:L-asparagine transporter-like permease